MGFPYTSVKMADENAEPVGPSCLAFENAKLSQSLRKTVRQFLIKRKHTQQTYLRLNNLTISYAILISYAREVKLHVHTNTWMWMVIVNLFIIVKNWTRSKCPLQWVNKHREVLLYSGILLVNFSMYLYQVVPLFIDKKELTCTNEDGS